MTEQWRGIFEFEPVPPATVATLRGQSDAELGVWWWQGEYESLSLRQQARLHYARSKGLRSSRPKGRRAKQASFAQFMKKCRIIAKRAPFAWYAEALEQLLRDETYEAPAMYRADAEAFYSVEFSGVPARQVRVLEPLMTNAPSWRPIETAPRGSGEDGPDTVTHPDYVKPPNILLVDEDGAMAVCRYEWYYHEGYGRGAEPGVPAWRVVDAGEPFYDATHWMPLPPPPGAEKLQQRRDGSIPLPRTALVAKR